MASFLSPQDALAHDIAVVVAASPQDAAAMAAIKKAGAGAGAKGSVFDNANTDNGCSHLGTLKHWNSVYKTDLRTFNGGGKKKKKKNGGKNNSDNSDNSGNSDNSDSSIADNSYNSGGAFDGAGGEIWYGEDVTEKMVNLVRKYCTTGAKVLDVGTGNGDLLCRLVECTQGTCPFFLGTDYSPDAVTLARAVLCRRGERWVLQTSSDEDEDEDADADVDVDAEVVSNSDSMHAGENKRHPKELSTTRTSAGHDRVEFVVDNILQSCIKEQSIDVFLDKGTLDALSCLFNDHNGTKRIERYLRALASLGKPGKSVLALTCANFTQSELKDLFFEAGWVFVQHVVYKTFSFGGGTGVHVNTMLYKFEER